MAGELSVRYNEQYMNNVFCWATFRSPFCHPGDNNLQFKRQLKKLMATGNWSLHHCISINNIKYLPRRSTPNPNTHPVPLFDLYNRKEVKYFLVTNPSSSAFLPATIRYK
jgi:hypothetical protein